MFRSFFQRTLINTVAAIGARASARFNVILHGGIEVA
jgi:hypothetical protein